MKVTTEHTQATIVRRASITEDRPVVPMAYADPPKQVRIDTVTITYTWNDGAWIVKSEWAIQVGGFVLKKDGTDGKSRRSRRAQKKRGPLPGTLTLAEDWEWLQAIVDLLRPEGGPVATALNGAEVGA